MYKIIPNVKELERFAEETADTLPLWNNEQAVTRIKDMAGKLDDNYGADRDIEADLGGYIVIFYGESSEVEKEYDKILNQYSLPQDLYEFEEKYQDGQGETVLRLYLCSSDYAVVTVQTK
ncbi:MAG: hypothetical protein NC420_07745 [Eubacterium sp.]|nr:hypothetical protein [Eubacterium sp.]